MIDKVNALRNFYNGKVYKSWNYVSNFFGDGILASKTGKDGSTTHLILSNNGKKRELLSASSRVKDVFYTSGQKGTYVFENINNGMMLAHMFSSNNSSFVVSAAKWFFDLQKGIPEKLYLKINQNSKSSKLKVSQPTKTDGTTELWDMMSKTKLVQVEEVLAKNFNYFKPSPLPATIILKTTSGEVIAIEKNSGKDNLNIAKQLGIVSEELGNNLNTIM